MKCFCVKKCFFNGRLYNVGEALDVAEKEIVPKHFSAKEVKVEVSPVEEEPKTFKELGEEEAKAVLKKKK